MLLGVLRRSLAAVVGERRRREGAAREGDDSRCDPLLQAGLQFGMTRRIVIDA